MNENTRLQTWISKDEKRKWEQAAKEKGLQFPDFVREALTLFAGFDPAFWRQVKARANGFGISPSIIIQNTIARRIADDRAKEKVYGPAPDILEEFQFTEKGPVPFNELLKNLTDYSISEHEDQKAAILQKDKDYSGSLPREEEEWLQNYYQRRCYRTGRRVKSGNKAIWLGTMSDEEIRKSVYGDYKPENEAEREHLENIVASLIASRDRK